VPDPREFLGHLKVKAKLAPDHWSDTFTARRFVSGEISSESLPDPTAIWRGS
jgi:AMMECR1 domain-containing protein